MERPCPVPDVATDPRPGVDEDDMIRNVVRLVFSGNKDGALHIAKVLESEDVFTTAIVFAEAGFADQFKDIAANVAFTACKRALDAERAADGGASTSASTVMTLVQAQDEVAKEAPSFVPASTKSRCTHDGCVKQAFFGTPGDARASVCYAHSSNEQIDICSARCSICHVIGKKTYPKYGASVGTKPVMCASHGRSRGMIDVNNPICDHPGCSKRAQYAKPGSKRMQKCAEHSRGLGYVIVGAPYCSCGKRAHWGRPGERPTSCAACAKERTGMVYLASSVMCERCKKKHANFGRAGDSKATVCGSCRKPGEVNLSKPLCECGACARFGIIGSRATHCGTCARSNKRLVFMPMRRCSQTGCNDLATHAASWHMTPLQCERHAHPGDVDVASKPCTSCGLKGILGKEGKCADCNPEAPMRIRLAKQTTVIQYLKAVLPDMFQRMQPEGLRDAIAAGNVQQVRDATTVDRPVDGFACGKERPDLFVDIGPIVLVVEVDERAHAAYDSVCEQVRMVNITGSCGGRPVLFIRYNPDAFQPGQGFAARKYTPRARLEDLARQVKRALSGEFTARMLNANDGKPDHEDVYRDHAVAFTMHLFYDGDVGKREIERLVVQRVE